MMAAKKLKNGIVFPGRVHVVMQKTIESFFLIKGSLKNNFIFNSPCSAHNVIFTATIFAANLLFTIQDVTPLYVRPMTLFQFWTIRLSSGARPAINHMLAACVTKALDRCQQTYQS